MLEKEANIWCNKGQKPEEHKVDKEQKEGKANGRGQSGQILKELIRYGQCKGWLKKTATGVM